MHNSQSTKSGELNVVTGAFGYTGKYITRQLLAMGKQVKTLTGHPERENPFGDRVSVAPFSFNDPEQLSESLRGASTLFNTYWIRFAYGKTTFETAIENTKTLIKAAQQASLRKIVHISITNPSEQSRLAYFRGKALLERAVIDSGLSYAIIRPAVIFGDEDILINNIAWLLRHFPVFVVPGKGDYRLQPVFVEDLAELAVRLSAQTDNIVVDAVGPEVFAFDELVRLIADKVQNRARIIHLPPRLAQLLSVVIGYLVHDVVLTSDEVAGLMDNLLISDGPPTGGTRLRDWLSEHAEIVGKRYACELDRHYW